MFQLSACAGAKPRRRQVNHLEENGRRGREQTAFNLMQAATCRSSAHRFCDLQTSSSGSRCLEVPWRPKSWHQDAPSENARLQHLQYWQRKMAGAEAWAESRQGVLVPRACKLMQNLFTRLAHLPLARQTAAPATHAGETIYKSLTGTGCVPRSYRADDPARTPSMLYANRFNLRKL